MRGLWFSVFKEKERDSFFLGSKSVRQREESRGPEESLRSWLFVYLKVKVYRKEKENRGLILGSPKPLCLGCILAFPDQSSRLCTCL